MRTTMSSTSGTGKQTKGHSKSASSGPSPNAQTEDHWCSQARMKTYTFFWRSWRFLPMFARRSAIGMVEDAAAVAKGALGPGAALALAGGAGWDLSRRTCVLDVL